MYMRFPWLLLFAMATSPVILAAQDSADLDVYQLIDEAWDYQMTQNPLWATRTGDHRFNDRLPVVSLKQAAASTQREREFLARSEAIDIVGLSNQAKLDKLLFEKSLREGIEAFEFKTYLIPITNRSGFHISFPETRRTSPLKTKVDYDNYIARLALFNDYVQQHIDLMRVGMEQGYTLPSVVLQGYANPIETHIVDDAEQSLFFEPLRKISGDVPVDDHKSLRNAARKVIEESVIPGYESFLAFMRDEYVPAARGSVGASALPNGREYYRYCVRKFTTLDLAPEEVHNTGLSEVKRIRSEMDEIRTKVGFAGDFSEFLDHLRSEPRFYAKSPEELLHKTSFVLKKMDGLLPSLFKTLPRTPYGIREVPDYIAPQTTTAYYMPPAGDGTQAGFYYVNTFDLKSRPLYGVQALSLHEAVPGHHLQLALQQEMDMPNFRKFGGFTAFIEGWALYSERLGLEVGFYEDPYDDFGRLTYEIWRACRLVVDTGIHYFGWSREQAIEFMEENSGLSKHNIRAEVDRYISWPGQALAYKTGELTIRELRNRAENELGDKFDVREFHEAVLSQGAVPLDVLERQIEAYIREASNG